MATMSYALRRLLDNLIYWLPGHVVLQNDSEAIVSAPGQRILISDDSDHARVTIWSEVAVQVQINDLSAVSEACSRYSEMSFDERGVSVGLGNSTPMVGLSVELAGLDVAALAQMVQTIAGEAKVVADALDDQTALRLAARRTQATADTLENVVLQA